MLNMPFMLSNRVEQNVLPGLCKSKFKNMGNIRVEIVKKLPLKWQITRFRSLHVRVLTSSPACVCFQAAAHQRGSYPGWEGRLAPRPPTQTWRGVCTGQTAPAPPPTSTRSHLRSLSNRIPSHDPFSSV